MLGERPTLAEFLVAEERQAKLSSDLGSLILDVAASCQAVSLAVSSAAIAGALGMEATTNVQGELQARLDVVAHEIFRRTNESTGRLAGMVSEETEPVLLPPATSPRGEHLLAFDPLDGSSNLATNVAVGSIFSITRSSRPGQDALAEDFLRPGAEQLCAGYAIYGPSTMLVLSAGRGVHGFTLDTRLEEFLLTHPDLRVPETTGEFAINVSNQRFWEPAVVRYVGECLAGRAGVRERDFNMRWIASLVAEAHRILMRGGVFLYPRDSKRPAVEGRLRLLYEANPIAFLIEQAGGAASTGRERILDVPPTGLHQRIGFVFGSRAEVQRVVRYHAEPASIERDRSLYGRRGLFRQSA